MANAKERGLRCCVQLRLNNQVGGFVCLDGGGWRGEIEERGRGGEEEGRGSGNRLGEGRRCVRGVGAESDRVVVKSESGCEKHGKK